MKNQFIGEKWTKEPQAHMHLLHPQGCMNLHDVKEVDI